MATRRIQNRPKAELQTEQKIAFVLLILLGIGGILFGFRSFGSQLYRPIQLQMAKYYTGQDVVNDNSADAKIMEEQKKKDSDGDGLSDYDELYIYHTSPYLKDSDSDGIDDKTEIFAGTDPNCPKGKDCGGGGEVVNTNSVSPQDIVSPIAGSTGTNSAGQVNLNSPTDVKTFLQSATAQEIRAALIQSGMSKADLDKVSDADLQKVFHQAITQATNDGTLNVLTSGAAGAAASSGTSQTNP